MEEKDRGKKKGAAPAITLRLFCEDDAEAVLRWARDGRILRYFDVFEDLAGASLATARRYISEELVDDPCFLVVCLGGADGEPVGAVSMTTELYERDFCRGEVGYMVAPEHWGRGVATAALGAAVEYLFRRWPHLERLEAVVEVENAASLRVLEKNGFLREGLLRKYARVRGRSRDIFMYGLLRSDLVGESSDEEPDM